MNLKLRIERQKTNHNIICLLIGIIILRNSILWINYMKWGYSHFRTMSIIFLKSIKVNWNIKVIPNRKSFDWLDELLGWRKSYSNSVGEFSDLLVLIQNTGRDFDLYVTYIFTADSWSGKNHFFPYHFFRFCLVENIKAVEYSWKISIFCYIPQRISSNCFRNIVFH